MLIVGLRILWKTLRGGTFRCPAENADKPYLLQEARRFFAVFFIPLIPLGKAGQAVRCESCKRRFPTSVLDLPTEASHVEAVTQAVRTAAVAMVAADGGVSAPAEARAKAVALVNELGVGLAYDDTKLGEDLRLLPVHDVQSVAAQVARAFDEVGRERLVSEIAAIATVNGPMTAGERRVVESLAAGLGMTPAHLRGVLDVA